MNLKDSGWDIEPSPYLLNAKALRTKREPTGGSRVVCNAQRVAVLIRVNREQSHAKGSILGEGSAVLKVLQVDPQLIISLNGQSMNPL